MKIRDLLNIPTNEIKLGSQVIVINPGYILNTAEQIAISFGYPNAAIGSVRLMVGEKEKKIVKDTEGKVVFMGEHPRSGSKIYVVETENQDQFLAERKAIDPIENRDILNSINGPQHNVFIIREMLIDMNEELFWSTLANIKSKSKSVGMAAKKLDAYLTVNLKQLEAMEFSRIANSMHEKLLKADESGILSDIILDKTSCIGDDFFSGCCAVMIYLGHAAYYKILEDTKNLAEVLNSMPKQFIDEELSQGEELLAALLSRLYF